MTQLSISSSELASKAVDFLVDMFNDSNDRVRLNAIRSCYLMLKQFNHQIILDTEQLRLLLTPLTDSSIHIIHSVLELLSVIKLNDKNLLIWLIEVLANSFKLNSSILVNHWIIFSRCHKDMINLEFVKTLFGVTNMTTQEPLISDPHRKLIIYFRCFENGIGS